MTWIPAYWLDPERLAEIENDPRAPRISRLFAQALAARAKQYDEQWKQHGKARRRAPTRRPARRPPRR